MLRRAFRISPINQDVSPRDPRIIIRRTISHQEDLTDLRLERVLVWNHKTDRECMTMTNKILILACFLLVVYILMTNKSIMSDRTEAPPVLLAHRGVSQQFSLEDLTDDTCTASRVIPSGHTYIENTLSSMAAAFDYGASVVEIDVQPTTDGHFVVFHDWDLDCRTDGSGITRESTLAELQSLDIGYGYTFDNGNTFPFRGGGLGRMPTLAEVLEYFPTRSFLINIKSSDVAEGEALADALPHGRSGLMVYGAQGPVQAFNRIRSDIPTLSNEKLESCLLAYVVIGWSGHVPGECRNSVIFVPENFSKFLWGWPDTFLERMEGAESHVFLVGPYSGDGFLTGIDDDRDVGFIPQGYSGGILTNRIEYIGPLLRNQFTDDD